MNERRWVAERAPRWEELRGLLERAQKRGLRSLAGAEVRRLGALYRAAATDLATARTLGLSEPTVRHVNRLCTFAHDLVYEGRHGGAARIGRFLRAELPVLFRRTWPWTASAAAAFLVAAVAGYVALGGDPVLADSVLGREPRERAERARALAPELRRYVEVSPLFAPVASWGLLANNVVVSLVAFAAGSLLVVPGVLHMMLNGFVIGGAAGVYHDAGVPGLIFTFVAAHGPVELLAVFVASGAGMRVGASVVVPGRLRRVAAFRETARDSVRLLAGTTLLLAVAAGIEGFVSPSALPLGAKLGVGAGSALLAGAWLLRGGRG